MKLLFIDIETSPNIADVWGLFNQNVSLSQLRQSSFMMCFAAKWQGDRKIEFRSYYHDGKDVMLKRAHQLMDEADVICHYNGNKFDIPILHKEFVVEGMLPPAPSRHIDLYSVVKRKFRFPSNKLEYVSGVLKLSGKTPHTGHDLWVKCLADNASAWRLMKKYNMQDVVVTEELYDKLLPWIPGHPNRRLYDDVNCPSCGTDLHLQKRGFVYLTNGKYQQYTCTVCGTWFRSSRRMATTEIQGVQ